MGPWYELHEDGNGWKFWILESDTTSYLHADIRWNGTARAGSRAARTTPL
jgi:hypothetical protein